MNPDLATLILWIQICLGISAFFTTVFPLFYSFSPWYKSPLGWLIMLQSIALAMAIDLTLWFQLDPPEPDEYFQAFLIEAIVLFLIAGVSASLTVLLGVLRHNYRKHKKELKHDDSGHPGAEAHDTSPQQSAV